ncbi:unnamed protein product, partial [Scytosiphon promiscuus]
MEFASGGTLESFYEEMGERRVEGGVEHPINIALQRSILEDVAARMAYLDREGITHGDIKPANI